MEKSLLALSATLDKDDSQETLKALQSPAANLPFVYRDKEAYKYHEALLKEKREGLPQILLVCSFLFVMLVIDWLYTISIDFTGLFLCCWLLIGYHHHQYIKILVVCPSVCDGCGRSRNEFCGSCAKLSHAFQLSQKWL